MLPAIIPVYQKPEQVDRCLSALRALTTPVDPWILDNNQENIGFTRAVNRGLRRAIKSGAPFALILNQDCYLLPDASAKILAFMDSHPRCAIAGVQQLNSQDQDEIIHAGGAQVFPTGKNLRGRASAGDCAVSKQVPWVNGACMIARLDAVLDFGLMDENFFLFGSDSDWCFSARLRNWEVWYIADAKCIHETGASGEASPKILDILRKDTAYFRDKWLGSFAYARLAQL